MKNGFLGKKQGLVVWMIIDDDAPRAIAFKSKLRFCL